MEKLKEINNNKWKKGGKYKISKYGMMKGAAVIVCLFIITKYTSPLVEKIIGKQNK